MLARILYYYAKALWIKRIIRTPEQLKNHQNRQLNKLVKKTLIHAPFYQPYLNKPLQDWPIMNKHIMMAHFDEINTQGLSKHHALEVALQAEQTRDFSPLIGAVSVGLSSGTTGTRGLFLADARERDAWAGTILAKTLPHGLRREERIAFFLRANNNLYSTLNKGKKIQFHFFDLLGDFDEHIKHLNEMRPTIISAPASVLLWLAQHRNKITCKPRKIISVAEVLEKTDELIIAEAFSCVVAQIYQCTEGFLAINDKQTNRLTMNDEFLIIEKEWLDERRFIPIITDLARTTQPIIRYRLDDVLIYSNNSTTYTELEGIEGRAGDVCYAVQGERRVPLFADSLRQHMVKSPCHFDDYRITQLGLNEFAIALTPDPQDKMRMEAHLNELFQAVQCECPQWLWQPYTQHEVDKKLRRIQSNCINTIT